MKKMEKEKHFYEEIFKIIKKNIIKILIVDIFPLYSPPPGYKNNAIYKRLEDIENIIIYCLIIKYFNDLMGLEYLMISVLMTIVVLSFLFFFLFFFFNFVFLTMQHVGS